ncbi:hypothetical protein HELRODRAFT_173092 [Helobdella robusta]|uniref:Uncharacterized protein n=1 Tax=Helobdella robusta TaxID=6412 RepID=T1F6C0_HELRO|nr:hypothetical protein HELRODRAFT_173092 [Helobdella robusta]ESO04023.1 hypothetical protein HELRODRAFT_173092 [Helobdella robusta]
MDVEKDLLIVDEVGVSSQQAGREQTSARPVFSDPERVYCRVADPGQERLRRSEGSENILLAILQGDAKHISELALWRILQPRKESKGKKVCEFKLPELEIDASSYYDLIDLAIEKITEPPLAIKYSDIEISNDISSKCLLEIEKYPCHTQAVERCVKLVTGFYICLWTRTNTSALVNKGFSHCSSWNSLPLIIRQQSSIETFKKRLRQHLFEQAFGGRADICLSGRL